MGQWNQLFRVTSFFTFFFYSYGCQLEGAIWPLPVQQTILDTYRGVVLDRATTNIVGINSISYGEALNYGPYVDINFANSRFVMSTNDAYTDYEKHETTSSMPITVTFGCTGGSTLIFTFIITVEDTNNNAPEFLPRNEFVYTISPPVPPGFEFTGCLNDLTVRDIDLTTQKIDFAVIDNPYFEIEYDAESSTIPKEFKAILRTTTFIRSVPEPITFTITATDVDLTGDAPLTTTAAVTILGNTDFELPEEPVFAKAFYLANYTDDNQIVLIEPISLRSGYDELVEFTLEGEFSNNFDLVRDGNQISIRVVNPLAVNNLLERQLFLIVRANREHTSGASATVVVQLPEEVLLEFESAHYEGTIEFNNLKVPQLILSQGYEASSVSAAVLNEYSSYFTAVVQRNTVTLSMKPLDESVITENSFIYLQIVASTDRSSATTIVTLEIIKDDNVTPVFSKPIYSGSYNPDIGLTIEQIVFVQGYDNSVSLSLEGDHADFFKVTTDGPIITLQVSMIPHEIFNEGHILLSLEASKPRTVGANAAISITLPEKDTSYTILGFDQLTYSGNIENNIADIGPITLIKGYTDDVTFELNGDLSSYFSLLRKEFIISVEIQTPIPAILIPSNRIIVLQIKASAPEAVTAHATILFEVILENDESSSVQLVFDAPYYIASYSAKDGLVVESPITLSEGYDDSVQFGLEGEYGQWFSLEQVQNSVTLTLSSAIPGAVLTNNQQLVFVITAERPGSTTARATIVISLTDEITEVSNLGFDRVTYLGTVQNNVINIGPITVIEGYTDDVTFGLYGYLASYFGLSRQGPVVNIELQTPIPPLLIPANHIIVIEIRASSLQAGTAHATIVLEVVTDHDDSSVVQLVFDSPYYTGSYNAKDGLIVESPITLSEGYDDSVQFGLEGEHAQWFSLERLQNSVTLTLSSAIPGAVLTNNQQLVFVITAERPGSTTARATIVISLTDEITEVSNLGFDRVTYLGTVQNNVINIGPITVIEGYTDDVTFGLYGYLASYFGLSRQGPVVNIELQTPIPPVLIPANHIIVIEIRASSLQAGTAHATIVLEVVTDHDDSLVVQLVFDSPYYTGSYNAKDGLIVESPITLSEGYDDSVQFGLEGEHAQWFNLERLQNSVTLTLSSAIPGAVLTNNQQLVFVITAERPGSTTARATIVISLTDDITEVSNLGFDRVTYLGTVQNNVINIEPITVIEGYTDDVTFGLYGDLASYFGLSRQGPVVNIELQTPIPPLLIPANHIIVIEIRASSLQAGTAHATIVLEVVTDHDDSSVVQLVFDSPYYTGSYNAKDGLIVESPITLSEGYDDSVQFGLEGEHAQWFSLERLQNSVTLTLSSAIPGAVLTNNQQLVFVITAERPGSTTARATIVISLTDEITEVSNLGFDRVTYLGTVQNNVINIEPITVIEGYTDDVTFGLYGDLASYFGLSRQGPVVNIELQTPIPPLLIPANHIIVIEIRASSLQAGTAHATIVLEVVTDHDDSLVVQLVFDSPYYTGSYNAKDGLIVESPITLSEGYDDSVQFGLEGEHAQWFNLERLQNSVTLTLSSAIPGAVLTNNQQLVFVITAERPGSTTARATIVISLTDEITEVSNLGFDRVTYLGTVQNNVINIEPITVIEGYTDDVTFGLYGDLTSYFGLSRQGPVVNIELQTPIPPVLIPANHIIVIEIRASSLQAGTAHATIVLEVVTDHDDSLVVQLVFDSPYYTGSYNAKDGLIVESPITLSEGYDDSIQFGLEGEHAQWFNLERLQNSVTLTLSSAIPGAVLTNNQQLVFVITAERPGSTTARATIVISLTDEITEVSNLGFDRVTYLGTLQKNEIDVGPITIVEGYADDVTFGLYGDLASYFGLTRQGPTVNIELQIPIPTLLIPANGIIVLEIRASSQQAGTTHATIVLEVITANDVCSAVQLVFDSPYYIGSYNVKDGLIVESPITLSEGYDDSVQFGLEGEHAQWFSLERVQNSVTLTLSSAIPGAVLTNNRKLVFVITAEKPQITTTRATIIISLTDDLQIGDDVTFEKILYEGIIQGNEVQHETIKLPGYDGTKIDLLGEYSSLFVGYVVDGVVSVQASGSLTLPADVTQLALELNASGARAVLLLKVLQADVPVAPTVSFSSDLYVLNVEIVQTGLIGRVSAAADNGETLIYSIITDDAHLQMRLSINNEGELYLSAPANSGVYTFQVIATTVITQATGTAAVHLTVEAVTVCGANDIVVPPLIVLDRDEEEPHSDLVLLDSAKFPGCHFSVTSRWPADQTWLYVDENGLHATAIDREHESIAFMALSQVQVELLLHCESDNIRIKRSERTDWLGPYDYGTNKWILADTIQYNSRRSFVNLIVNDINDNSPIFVGKDHEPIAVGYPVDELVERILPRSLAELKATDADIGENAALRYWSSESAVAVAPTTGLVHVRPGATLQHNQTFVINATDRSGEGRTGSIQLLVKLLELDNIAVVTVRDAFLDDETNILTLLSDAVGYEIKTLRSIIISDDIDENITKKKRETNTTASLLRLYVYGLIDREPVTVNRLAEDINNSAAIVSVISTLSLEDHLKDSQINIFQRDIGLLVATIVLSILLFIVILLIAIWFFLKWRKNRTYNKFSDANSLASRNESIASEQPKTEALSPRLNIEDLKRSEKRLQEMLDAPIEEVTIEPMTAKQETPLESILDLPLPEANVPIVIQSIDKLKDPEESDGDEFGENKEKRRKSVVTFNENVERIIHVEDLDDADDTDSSSDYVTYKL